MPRVNHFEIHAENPVRAVNFYKTVFGWEINMFNGMEDFWIVTTGPDTEPGINGSIFKRRGIIDGEAVIAYVCSMDVNNVDDYIARVTSNGGIIVVPKMAVPKVGWLSYCKDTEGNIFGLMQSDPKAS